MFTGLLICGSCGTTLSSMKSQWNNRWYCRKAHLDTSHPRPYKVSERKVMLWAQALLDGARTIVLSHGSLPDAGAVTARLADLDAKRERIVDMYADGTLTKPQRDSRLALLAADRAKTSASLDLTGPGLLSLRPSVDWDAPPAVVNKELKALWKSVVMNGGMFPHRAVWHPTDAWDEDGPR